MIALVSAILMPVVVGYLLATLAFDRQVLGPRRSVVLLKCFLACGVALGGASCTFFLWLVLVGDPGRHYVLTESLILGGLAAVLFHHIKTNKQEWPLECSLAATPKSPLFVVLLISFAVVLIACLLRFVFLSFSLPHGEDDALGIWNLRARFLLTGGDHWRESLSMLLAKSNTPDYPLLLPGAIARAWSYLGADSQLVPQAVAMLFTFAIVGLGLFAVSVLRTYNQGLLAGLVLLGTPFLIRHGASQYADVPLAFYILATLVLFCLLDKSEGSQDRLLPLAGAMAGFAAWTKNEGSLFLVAIILARLVVVVPKHGWKDYLRQMLAFAKGLLPVLAIVGYFKTRISPATTEVLSQDARSILDKLQQLSSYQEVGIALAGKILELGHPGLVVLAMYLGLLGIRKEENTQAGLATSVLVLILMLTGYVLVIIVTPFNSVRYQLDYSLDRLWLHLWPSAVLVYFLLARTPEEAVEAEKPRLT